MANSLQRDKRLSWIRAGFLYASIHFSSPMYSMSTLHVCFCAIACGSGGSSVCLFVSLVYYYSFVSL